MTDDSTVLVGLDRPTYSKAEWLGWGQQRSQFPTAVTWPTKLQCSNSNTTD